MEQERVKKSKMINDVTNQHIMGNDGGRGAEHTVKERKCLKLDMEMSFLNLDV